MAAERESASPGPGEHVDPATFSVIMGAYQTIAREMVISLERSAWTPIISQCRDFSVTICDGSFNLIAVPDETLPVQAMSMHRAVKNTAAFFEGDISDGDVLMCNLAYLGNTHIGEPLFASPVFVDGELLFWAAARGHVADIGTPAYLPSYPYAKDVYSEGLKISPVKLYERGQLRRDMLELYLTNLRARPLSHGDLMAHVAATWRGKDSLLALADVYGAETLKLYTRELIDYTERRVADEIRTMTPGTYYGEDWLDSNNYGTKNIPIRVKLTVEEDRWIVDLSDNPPQMIGPLNSTLEGATEAAAIGSLAFALIPRYPRTRASTGGVQIISSEGTILSAQHPFSTQEATMGAGEMLYRALLRAAAGACSEMVVAGSTLIQFSVYIGIDERGEAARLWSYANFNECGGGGGALGTDGSPCMMEMGVAGGMRFASAEMEEWLYPVVVEQCEIYEDSQGAGRWRGAPGVITRVRGDDSGPMEIYSFSWGHNNLSHGTMGGSPGVGGTLFIRDPANPARKTFYSGFGNFTLPSGWEYAVIASGGGGYGDPLEREPESVAADVRDGIVSPGAALDDYGVVLVGATHEIDDDATEERRRRLRSARGKLPVVSPTSPGSSTLRRRLMNEGDTYIDLDRSPEDDPSLDLLEV